MNKSSGVRWAVAVLALASPAAVAAGTIAGYVRDHNWYARYAGNPYGVGYYEIAVNANTANASGVGGAAATDVYGRFQMTGVAAGPCTVASWDVWWRSAFAFNVPVPTSGSAPPVDLRLHATMWGYPAFWDDAGYYEFGQTFVATGPVSMVYLRCPFNTSYSLTIHEGGPDGLQIGVARSFGGGDQRPIYGYGDMPTAAGRTYYARIRTASPAIGGVLMQMDPRPDFSDPMPGGCLWLGNGATRQPFPDRDLGLVIMSDDDGLLTDLFARPAGTAVSDVASVGQTLVARGSGLISAAFWLADPAAPACRVRILEDGPGGAPVGTAKVGKPARVTADPEMLVTWSPGECPLEPGRTYYAEVTRSDGGALNSVYVNRSNPFPHGQAFANHSPLLGVDLAGTLIEETAPGRAAELPVRFLSDPSVAENDRGTNGLVVRWTTDVAADAQIEFAAVTPPYSDTITVTNLATTHALALNGLTPHTLYHLRVSSAAPGRRRAVSRDFTASTRPRRPNLLANPGFEDGSGSSPRRAIPGWQKTGGLDMGAANGTWFGELPPRTGSWLFQGALNGSTSDGTVYQRVPVTAGRRYTFSAWAFTKPLERVNNQTVEKYDVWNDRNRLIYLRLGLDPTGGTNPNAATVQWTPRAYSHLHYSNLARNATAQAAFLTVFIRFQGQGVEWHLFGLDDCVLTETETAPPRLLAPALPTANRFAFTLAGEPGLTNRIEAATNPAAGPWLPLTNVLNATGATPVSVAVDTSQRFFRAVVP